jgi:pimeloyl-ACP methyl ester carboxylesterase
MAGTITERRDLLLTVDAETTLDVRVDEPAGADNEPIDSPPAIVLLPSSQRDSLDFDPFATRLAAAGFRVLRPQPRGMARSRGPLNGLTLNVLAQDIARVVEHCGAGRAIIAGHAFGHYVARVTDLNHPSLVRGVVLLAAAARDTSAELSQVLDVAADATQPRDKRRAALRQAFFAPGNDEQVWLEGWHPALRDIYRRAGTTPAKAVWWPVSNSPILEVQGEDDPWRPAPTRSELRDALGSKVTLRLISNASHALLPEQPAAVAGVIIDWAARLTP